MVTLPVVSCPVVIHHLYVSPGHNYFGHHGKPPGGHAMVGTPAVQCRAGWGLEGDRFFGYRPDYKGQITLFSWETYLAAKQHFSLYSLEPTAFRRNVLIEGVDLATLIGARFMLGGIELLGTEECRPCYWMDTAVAPGAENWLRGQGGLRARIVSDGELCSGPHTLAVLSDHEPAAGAGTFGGKSLVGA